MPSIKCVQYVCMCNSVPVSILLQSKMIRFRGSVLTRFCLFSRRRSAGCKADADITSGKRPDPFVDGSTGASGIRVMHTLLRTPRETLSLTSSRILCNVDLSSPHSTQQIRCCRVWAGFWTLDPTTLSTNSQRLYCKSWLGHRYVHVLDFPVTNSATFALSIHPTCMWISCFTNYSTQKFWMDHAVMRRSPA